MTERPPITRASPALVRTGDALTLALLLLAGSVAISGGFRVWVGGWRLSVTSPERLLLAALLLTSLRHWFVRRPALPERLVAAARRAHGSEAVRAVWPVAIGSRAAVAAVGLLAVFLVGYSQGAPPFSVSKNELINLPARWDAGWYLTIAQVGYRWDRRSRGQQNIAFFPAYPMLMRVGGRLLGGSTGQVVLAGVLISYAAFLGGLLYLFKLARGHPALASSDRARAAVLLLGSYPFAVFYGTLSHRGTVPLCHRRRVLAHAAAATLEGCRVGPRGGAHTPEWALSLPAARPDGPDRRLAGRGEHSIAHSPGPSRAAGRSRTRVGCAGVFAVPLPAHG